MPGLTYVLFARDTSTAPPGVRLVGLKPTWVFLEKLADGSGVTPQPAITEVADGQYKLQYDPEASGEASGQVDLGATVVNPSDRYVDVVFYLSDSRTTYNLDTPVSTRMGAPLSPSDLQAIASATAGAVVAAIKGLPQPVDAQALAQAVAALIPPPSAPDPRALAAAVVAALPPEPTKGDIAAAVVAALPPPSPAPALDPAATAAAIGPLIAAPVVNLPAPVVTVNPTPVTVAAPDLSALMAELAAIEADLKALPDASAAAALARLVAARAAYDAALGGLPAPARPADPQPAPGQPANN